MYENQELESMRKKLKQDRQQLRKWKQMDQKLEEDHRSLSDKEVAQSYKLKVAIVCKEKAIYKQVDIIRCQ